MNDTRQKNTLFYVLISLILASGFLLLDKSYSVLCVLVVWVLLILFGMSQNNSGNALNIDSANALRGICALEIMLGHIGLATNNIFLFPNRKAGILFVGIFFLLSGYGLSYSLDNKENYLNSFSKRIARILIIFTPLLVCFCVIKVCINPEKNIVDIIINQMFNSSYWYVWELLGLYLLFYVIAKYKKEKLNLIMLISTMIFVVIAFLLGLNDTWFGSTLAFPLGMYYYSYLSKKEREKSKVPTWLLFIIFSLVLAASILCFFVSPDSFIGNCVARNIATVMFCLLVLIILSKIKLGNPVISFVSKISFEIYLIHSIIEEVLLQLGVNNDYIFLITTIILSIVVSYFYNRIIRRSKSIKV